MNFERSTPRAERALRVTLRGVRLDLASAGGHNGQMRFQTLLAAASLTALAAACTQYGPDNCEGGQTMSDLRLDPAVPLEAGSQAVQLLYSAGTGRGAELPAAYFQSPTPMEPTPAGAAGFPTQPSQDVSSIVAPDAGTLRLMLTRPLGAGVVVMALFPDRRDFISCQHPGMSDAYYVRINVTPQSGDGGYTVSSQESVRLGAL